MPLTKEQNRERMRRLRAEGRVTKRAPTDESRAKDAARKRASYKAKPVTVDALIAKHRKSADALFRKLPVTTDADERRRIQHTLEMHMQTVGKYERLLRGFWPEGARGGPSGNLTPQGARGE